MSAPARRLSLGSAERQKLIDGALAFGVVLGEPAVDRFCAFSDLLSLWSGKLNLISCRSPQELLERHILDSLAVAPLVMEAARAVDLGSGAGLPGVPLAVAYPGKHLVLLEPRRRRASFLREVSRTLGLENVEIVEARAEDAPVPHLADVALCRAVWSDDAVLPIARRWLGPADRLVWMRGREPGHGGMRRSSPAHGLVFERVVTYRIGKGPERAIEVWSVEAS